MEDPGTIAAAQALTDVRRAEVAGEDAAVLQAAGIRTAEELQAGGTRDAEALAAAGAREAAVLRTEEQRNISRMWESTQKYVALVVVTGFTISQLGVVFVILGEIRGGQATALMIALLGQSTGTLAAMMTLVIGFYFSRTNHTQVGGLAQPRRDAT